MADQNPFMDRLREPLSPTTRRVRRNVLAASAVGIAIVKVPLVPSKIPALGIDFTSADQGALLLFIAAIVTYYGISFITYVISEVVAWQLALRQERIDRFEDRQLKNPVQEEGVAGIRTRELREDLYRQDHFWVVLSQPIFLIRATFEVLVPVLLAVYSVVVLVSAELPIPSSDAHAEGKSATESSKETRH